MNDSLQVYLNDHLAGSSFAVELLQYLRDQTEDGELARFAGRTLADVEADVAVLKGIVEGVGDSGFTLKQAAGWVAEKASRFKLHHGETNGLGTFEALEILSLGILGKQALWRVLAQIAETDSRVGETDFKRLGERAYFQYRTVEAYRLRAARTAFSN